MRDRRFIVLHRGGELSPTDHRLLALWAADCAETILFLYKDHHDDCRPQHALDVIRAWARGEVKTGVAMKASVAAHAAARLATDRAAVAAARAAAQAVATAHFADHCIGAVYYAMKARAASGDDAETEKLRRLLQLPTHLRELVQQGMAARMMK
jgi:hypothetical protein